MRFQATLARTLPSAAGHGRLSREISCSGDRRARVNALRPSALGPIEGEREEREKEGTPAKKNERGAVEGFRVSSALRARAARQGTAAHTDGVVPIGTPRHPPHPLLAAGGLAWALRPDAGTVPRTVSRWLTSPLRARQGARARAGGAERPRRWRVRASRSRRSWTSLPKLPSPPRRRPSASRGARPQPPLASRAAHRSALLRPRPQLVVEPAPCPH